VNTDFGGGPVSGGGFLAVYEPGGAHRLSRGYSGVYAIERVAVGGDGIVFTGTLTGTADFGGGALATAGGADVFIASLATAGAHRWSRRFGATDNQNPTGLAVDAAGNSVLAIAATWNIDVGTGLLTGADDYDLILASFDAAGVTRWARRYGD